MSTPVPEPSAITTCANRSTERRWGAAGTGASALLAVGGFGVGAVPARLSDSWLHATSTGRAVSYVLCAAGVLGLLVCWWRLKDAGHVLLLRATAAWSAPLLLTPPLLSRDVYAYAGQAHLVAVGLNPYTHGPVDAPGPLAAEVDDVWGPAPSPYGPVFLRLASWLVPGEHVILAVVLLRLLAVAGLALLAWSLLRFTDRPGPAVWLAVANPLVLLHAVGGAHNDVVMAGLLVAGLAVASRPGCSRLVAGAALITVAALVKVPAAAALGFLPLMHPGPRLRGYAAVAGTALVSGAAVTVACNLGWGWLETLGAGNPRRSLLSVSTGAGTLLANAFGEDAVGAAHSVGLLLAAACGLLLLIRAPRIGPVRALGLALLAAVVLGPVVQPWYLLWALAPLAAVAGPRLAAGLAAASAVLCLLILPSGRHLIRPPLYGVPVVLALAAGYAAARLPARAEAIDATT